MAVLSVADALAYLPLPSSMMWNLMQDEDNTITWANLDNAADMLYYYLRNYYNEIILDEKDVIDVISCHDNNMLHLEYNINQLMTVAEQTTYNNKKILCTTSASDMRVVCMVDRNTACELRNVNVNGVTHPNKMMKLQTGKQADWNLALGSCYGGMIAEVTSDGNIYSMKYKYYILDIYEWSVHRKDEIDDPDQLSQMLHFLHEQGIAHQYLITGYYEGELTWNRGETTANESVMQQIKKSLGIEK